MKKFVLLFVFLVSCQYPVSAMMLNPHEQQERKAAKSLRTHSVKPTKWFFYGLSPLPNEAAIQKEQTTINKMVCKVSAETYGKINANWTYVAPHDTMRVDSPFWEARWIKSNVLDSGEKKELEAPTLVLKTSPERVIEAFEDLLNKPASLECTIALTAVKIACMQEILGKEKFKQYATHFYHLLTMTEGWSLDQFFHELPLQFIKKIEGKPCSGSIAYITNVPFYKDFKPTGNGRGSNVICVADGQYLGFSGIYKNGPQPLEIIEQQDLALFCDPKDVECHHESHKEMCVSLSENKGLFEKFRRTEQEKHCNFHGIFDAKKFIDLRQTGEINL